ncbi:ABC transporter substrate-binding protein [Streptomyces sp. TS71-3]|uniref:ABC transporter substrate-binding protein n=1 Tax=Streptomyces sp. TS71-3 TaxID=2733862 RepID=UPI001B1BC2B2|nr:ABC transporter substrate-binding protein [Streptomyces sp. TS71-3]GHJ36756.1 ABC transporter substrate-binding protein [Streptomyces sp. TS71-3]
MAERRAGDRFAIPGDTTHPAARPARTTGRLRGRATGAGAAAAAALLLASCSTPGSGSSSETSPNTLVVSTPTEPDSLDPTLANTFAARLVFTSFCEKLYDVDAKLRVVPQLAAALPKVSKDGRTMDIAVRKGVRFNDGTPLNAAAVKTTLDRDLTMKASARAGELEAVSKVEVLDPYTVRLKLKHPSAPLVAQLADRSGLVMSPAALKKLGDDFGTAPVCVGPFKYQDRVSGNEMDFVKSPVYYDADKVRLDGIRYKFITNSSVATANLESGDVDAAEHIDANDAITLKGESGTRVLHSDTIAYQSLSINVRKNAGTALSRSSDLRKAFEMSIDRDALNTAVWKGQNLTDCGPLPAQSPLRIKPHCTPFDPDAARALVKKSGIPHPSIELMVPTGAATQREAQVVQSMAQDVGFKVSVRPIDLVSGLDLARTGKYDAFLEGWSGRVDPDGDTNDIVTTGGSNNFSGYSDKKVDALIKQAASTNDTRLRSKYYAQAVERVGEARPLLYLYHNRWFLGTSTKVHGIVYQSDSLPRFKTAYLSR